MIRSKWLTIAVFPCGGPIASFITSVKGAGTAGGGGGGRGRGKGVALMARQHMFEPSVPVDRSGAIG